MVWRKRAPMSDLGKPPLPALVSLEGGGTAILVMIDDTGDTGTRSMVLQPDGQRPEIWSGEQVEARFKSDNGHFAAFESLAIAGRHGMKLRVVSGEQR